MNYCAKPTYRSKPYRKSSLKKLWLAPASKRFDKSFAPMQGQFKRFARQLKKNFK